MLLYCFDLNLDLITLILKFDLDIMKRYRVQRTKFLGHDVEMLEHKTKQNIHRPIDLCLQTDMIHCITMLVIKSVNHNVQQLGSDNF